VLFAAYLAQVVGQQLGTLALGGFLGAVAASLGATLVELRRPQLARLVVFLPAFWLLVPGSLGLVGVSQLVVDPLTAVEAVLAVVGLITAIALGLLVGSALARALRAGLAARSPA
ncbi:MAG TPA: threonine/serine exporter family protein, partial [Ornithinicoccus sp.]|nr:threonine/serine exporter family protein [Ornithinicoccus sp.]